MTPRNKALIREKQISIIEKQIEQIVDIAKISNISKEEVRAYLTIFMRRID